MNGLTLAQLRSIDAVVSEGSLQAAALRLGRTHPTLHTAITNVENQIGFPLFDRAGYRMTLTPVGEAFLSRARRVLAEMADLQVYAAHLAAGEESEVRVVIGDLSPLPEMLQLLRTFFDGRPATRLHLQFAAISGPWELLMQDRTDLILHHVDQSDPRFETINLRRIRLIPVVAPNFLPFPVEEASLERMRDLVQCIIRDSAEQWPAKSYYVIEGARTCTVSDQLMKKEVILQGLGWGHMPDFLVDAELRDGRLISMANSYFHGGVIELVAARRAGRAHGPAASALWRVLQASADSNHKP
ncbi:LysR family transcriptional regulator [Rhizobium sp. P28RR-XV]|uniref:LysR family transcriptional regulator n=1 Tax=Rhizobium sp. P28RR-XV TaxID=2726737 RepID=UPI0014578A70|nr:LysR family transcriptional regulator [Rhizobium sp. P28RR-XV]NLR86440.1 LysR family transcriptional regulator [Rhizobium sp. P28RR-XV]